jgi:ABC-2 type transport system ATP-binding protein
MSEALPQPSATSPPQGDPLVEVVALNRLFDTVHAVRDLSFTIPRGAVVGFIGANGAGKTTTMRIMATLDEPTSGSVVVDGHDVVDDPRPVRRLVGWMPDSFGTYANMNVFEYLDFFARSYGFGRTERRARVEEVMDFADLTPLADRQMGRLSKGMAQRLCFGRMLIPDPPFLILDEPAAGLDPKARLEFKNLVRLLAARGKTLFISSHILSELGEMCDSLLFIDGGRLVFHGEADALKHGVLPGADAAAAAVVQVVVAGDPAPLVEWAETSPGWRVVEVKRDGARLECAAGDAAALADGLRLMVGAGISVVEFRREQRRLEEAFVEMVKGGARRGES